MKKALFILILPFYLFSGELEATYDISYGIFGTLGKAQTRIYRDDENYTITARAKTQGIAKFLSNNRQEIYTSRGRVVKGLLYPDEYKKVKSTNSYIKEKKYTFDHINKTVMLERTDFYKSGDKRETTKVKFSYYAPNDILSLYFNLNTLVKGENKKDLVFNAVGAKEDDGRVDIEKPEGVELEKMKEFMKMDIDSFLKVSINQNIFSSEKGEMLINVDKNNICNKAVLKDVLLFGDITAVKTDKDKETFE